MVRKNHAKAILKNSGIAVGAFMTLTDPAVFEVMGRCGYDFLIIDDEHSHYNKETLKTIMLSAEQRGIDTTPLVRLREGSVGAIKNALDMGALGIQVPMVDTAEQARAVIDAAYYPPVGHRGFGSAQHAIGYGFMDKFEYIETANREVLNVLQIESMEAIRNLDEILDIAEVDVVFVGAMDLSCSMGTDIMCRRRHPELVRVFNDAIKRIVDSGKIAGAAGGTEADVRELCDMGVRYLCMGNDLSAIRSATVKTLDMCKNVISAYT